MKKLFAIILALAMTFALSAVAIAQTIDSGLGGNGTITVNTPNIGSTYKLYKVFDATYSGENNASYTYSATEGTDNFLTALQAETSPFTATRVGTSNVYTITKKNAAVTGEAIFAFLKAQANAGNLHLCNPTDGIKPTADDSEVKWTKVTAGYYLVLSDIITGGSVAVTNAKPNATVNEKGRAPGWDDPDGDEGAAQGGKNILEGTNLVTENTAKIGDTVTFNVYASVPKIVIKTGDTGGTAVNSYTLKDTFQNPGLTYQKDVKVYIRDESTPITWHLITASETNYTVNPENDHDFTLVLKTTAKAYAGETATGDANFEYPQNAHIKLVYTAKVDINAVYENVNSFTMHNDVNTTDLTPTTTTTKVYGFGIWKYTMENNAVKELTDNSGPSGADQRAQFKLYDNADCADAHEVKLMWDSTNNYYRPITGTEAAETIKAGDVKIWGLKAGTYHLKETNPPAGFNPIATTTIELSDANCGNDGMFDVSNTHSENENKYIEVLNNSGSTLPETGGIGRAIFYVIGGLLMVGAVVLLVVRKKMSVME